MLRDTLVRTVLEPEVRDIPLMGEVAAERLSTASPASR